MRVVAWPLLLLGRMRLTPVLFLAAIAASACVAEDDLSFEPAAPQPQTDRPLGDGAEPADPPSPDIGLCAEFVGPAATHAGNVALRVQGDVDALAGFVAVEGRLDIAPDPNIELDLAPMSSLRCVGGDVTATGPTLVSLEGLHELTYVVGHVMIEDAPLLRDVAGLRGLAFVAGELRVRRTRKLVDLAGLKSVVSVGHLVIAENDGLVRIEGLTELHEVVGSVIVRANPSLESLGGLSAGATVGQSVVVHQNPRLPTCAVMQWIAEVTASGQHVDIEVAGNDDASQCG